MKDCRKVADQLSVYLAIGIARCLLQFNLGEEEKMTNEKVETPVPKKDSQL